MDLAFALVFLVFLAGLWTGSRDGRPYRWYWAAGNFILLALVLIVWQWIHGWPGPMYPGFVSAFCGYTVLSAFGIIIGGIVFGKSLNESSSQSD